ncbi:MAG: hypothetical protein J6J75_02565 [Alistipes sp.]|nr:hypothetical protein [Alistipes sp.]
MKSTNLLLPHAFAKICWCILLPSIAIGAAILLSSITASDYARILNINGAVAEIIINDTAIIGIILGAIFVTCAKEPVEDEMISSVRRDSLLVAFYISCALLIASTILVNGLFYINVMMYNMFAIPLVFLAVFRIKIWRLKKGNTDEE